MSQNRSSLLVSTSRAFCLSSIALLTAALAATSVSADTQTLVANQDTYIYRFTADQNYGAAASLQITGRSNHARKAYLGFDLSGFDSTTHFDATSSLSLTLSHAPLIGAANGSVTINVYGVTDNTTQFSQGAITWNDAPKNNTGSATNFLPAGISLLGTIVIDSDIVSAGATVTLTGNGLSNYLNWAIGNSGDFYGTGATQADAHKITLLLGISADNTGNDYPGFNFYSTEASVIEGQKPLLTLNTSIPEPSTTAAIAGAIILTSVLILRRRKNG